jgi:hypothetical protein
MFSVIFKGFETKEQAEVFAEWYSGSGEQAAADWLEEHSDIRFASAQQIAHSANAVVVDLKLYKK